MPKQKSFLWKQKSKAGQVPIIYSGDNNAYLFLFIRRTSQEPITGDRKGQAKTRHILVRRDPVEPDCALGIRNIIAAPVYVCVCV